MRSENSDDSYFSIISLRARPICRGDGRFVQWLFVRGGQWAAKHGVVTTDAIRSVLATHGTTPPQIGVFGNL